MHFALNFSDLEKNLRHLPAGPVAARQFGTSMKPKRTILCVDDNEQLLSIRKIMLETRGYRVVACNNGEDALQRFRNGGVDLVLADLYMPGLDGGKLIEEIKTISPHTPAILVSGKVKICDRDTRADLFLAKGMQVPSELLEKIRVLLVRKRGPKRSFTHSSATHSSTTQSSAAHSAATVA